MKPDICSFCKGKLVWGTTEFVATFSNQVIIISDIPAWVCQNCGEAYYDEKTSNEIDKVMKKVHEGDFRAKPMAAGKISLSEISQK